MTLQVKWCSMMFSSLTRARAELLLSSANRISGLNWALKLAKILNVIKPSNNHEWACNHDKTKYRQKLQNQNFGNFLGYLTALISECESAFLRSKRNKTNFTVFPWVNLAFFMCLCVGDLGCPRTQNMFKWITVERFSVAFMTKVKESQPCLSTEGS